MPRPLCPHKDVLVHPKTLLIGGVALIAITLLADPSFAEESQGYKTARDQGVHYLRRKMFPIARQKLEQAVKLPGGDKDFRTRLSLAKVYYEQLVLERAIPEAEAASKLARDDRQQRQADALLGRMRDFFAGVTVVQDDKQKGEVEKGIIHLENIGGLINRKKKAAFQRIRERFAATPVKLPTTIYLPFGKYKANGAQFEIKKGATADAVTFLYLPDTNGAISWWYVGGGLVAVGAATGAVLLLVEPDATERRVTLTDMVVRGTP